MIWSILWLLGAVCCGVMVYAVIADPSAEFVWFAAASATAALGAIFLLDGINAALQAYLTHLRHKLERLRKELGP